MTRPILELTAVTVVACLAAGLLASRLDVASHHFWAMVTVAAIFSAPASMASFERLSHRVVGTLAGVGLAAALFADNPPALLIIVIISICSFIVEVVVGVHDGIALAFITPLAIGASNLGQLSDWSTLFVDRSRETLLGGAVAFCVILAVRVRMLRRGELRTVDTRP